ncbi:CBS domain-containing protein [Aerosakkonema funiforme]|uniref:CBS domain-containing protein n=1 Tax=Aerosakkonema funiforme TaxID=1246630 RepID=UPI0035B6EE7B
MENSDASIEDTKVITHDFCILKDTDTVAEALALVTVQNASEIVIVDEDKKFVGILTDLLILRSLPPPVLDVPVKFRIKTPKLRKQLNNELVKILKKQIKDVFKPEKIKPYTSKNYRLIYAIDKLVESSKSTSAIGVLPIINEDETVYGVASPESILTYLKSHQKFCQLKAERFLALPEVSGMEQPYTLLPSDTLAQARFAMKYLPIDHITICDRDGNLLGIVDKKQVTTLTHPMYFSLMGTCLSEIMKPLTKLCLVEKTQTLQECIDACLNLGFKEVVIVEKLLGKTFPKMVVMPIDILQLRVQVYRQN